MSHVNTSPESFLSGVLHVTATEGEASWCCLEPTARVSIELSIMALPRLKCLILTSMRDSVSEG